MSEMSYVIAVAGPSGSGKSHFAEWLIGTLGKENIALLPMDSYYRDLPDEADPLIYDFDSLMALAEDKYVSHLAELKSGNPVECPVYDFDTHKRETRTELIEPRKIIIAEGILVLASEKLKPYIDYSVYVDVPHDLALCRRLKRDAEKRGRANFVNALKQYENTAMSALKGVIDPSKKNADLILDGRNDWGPQILDTPVWDKINALETQAK